MVWASILGTKIDENRRRKAPKALKLRKNVVFGRHRFFIVFSMHFSMNFGSPRRARGGSQNRLFRDFFRFFLRGRPFWSISGDSGPILVDFGLFWVDFLCFFEVNFQMKHCSDIRLFYPNFSFCRVTLIRATDEHLIDRYIDR